MAVKTTRSLIERASRKIKEAVLPTLRGEPERVKKCKKKSRSKYSLNLIHRELNLLAQISAQQAGCLEVSLPSPLS